MDSLSPLHTQLLRKRSGRRIILSSDEETLPRPSEVQDTPCASSTPLPCTGGQPPQGVVADNADSPHKGRGESARSPTPGSSLEEGESSRDHDTLIMFTHQADDPWETEVESNTSTPEFKRGIHREPCSSKAAQKPASEDGEAECDAISQREWENQEARALIIKEGIDFRVPSWIENRKIRQPSVLILADGQLNHWPVRDRLCKVVCKDWPIRRWTHAIRTGEILHSGIIS